MRKSIMLKVGAVGTTFAMAGALAIAASGTTGAYFSDTKTGGITGTVGTVHIATSGGAVGSGDGLNFSFANLLPGEAQTAKVDFVNSGTSAQDVWLTFPNGPALHALNNAGTYAEVHVTGPAMSPFGSMNLQDGRTRLDLSNSCGSFSEAGCWPLPPKLLVASNVPMGGSGSVTFSFMIASKLGNNSNIGGVFNRFPSNYGPGHEAFGDDIAGTPGSGLPFNVVAVQVGQQP